MGAGQTDLGERHSGFTINPLSLAQPLVSPKPVTKAATRKEGAALGPPAGPLELGRRQVQTWRFAHIPRQDPHPHEGSQPAVGKGHKFNSFPKGE